MNNAIVTVTTAREKGTEWIKEWGLNTDKPFKSFLPFLEIKKYIKTHRAIINVFADKEIIVIELETYRSIKDIIDYLILILKLEQHTEVSYMEFKYDPQLQVIRHSKSG